MKTITIKLQENRVIVETDPSRSVLPSAICKAILRVGFSPEKMEVWAQGRFEKDAFLVGDSRWPLVKPGPAEGELRRARLKVGDGAEDPPRVEFVE